MVSNICGEPLSRVSLRPGNLSGQPYPGDVNTIHLTDAELEMTRHGMTAYLRSFGHDEADTLVLIKAVLARLALATKEPDTPVAAG